MLVIGSEKVHGDGPLLIRTLQSLSGVLENRMAASVKAVLTCTLVLIVYGTIAHVLALNTISVRESTFCLIIFSGKIIVLSIIYKKKNPFISLRNIVSINELTLILENIGLCDAKHITLEGLDIPYITASVA
jgi:hypothetical protein